jgi:tetratricopeptide (TPR) repeat protein
MSETVPARHASEQEAGERFKRFAAFLITSLIIVAAVVSVLQARAGNRAARLGREAQNYAIRAMGLKTSGQAEVGYAWQGAYQHWIELEDLAGYAEDEVEIARYEAARDRLVELTPLLNPPYFDPEAGDRFPDRGKYEADVYLVAATALSEHYTDASEQNEAWEGIARAHTTHLTLLAVSLSLYGLATTISGRFVRWLFVAAGTLIAAFTILWLLIVVVWPVSSLSDEAIDRYAEGVGLSWQGDDENTLAAIERFSEALDLEPGYANALYERGNAHLALADSAKAEGNDDEVTARYEAAVADFEAARDAGRDDTNVGWNLGWTYYLLGRHDDAIRTDRRVLSLDPDLVGVRTNLGIALLSVGRVDEAQQEYQNAMDTAARIVTEAEAQGTEPPESLWWYLDAGAIDLLNLLDRLDGREHAWTQAPPPESVADPDTVRAVGRDTIKQLKELLVALEYTSVPPFSDVSAEIAPFEFGQARADEGYDKGWSFPYGTDHVLVLFDYAGMQVGQTVLWKVYADGFESPELRLEHDWGEALGESGAAEWKLGYAYTGYFIFSPGEYVVEMYVDNRLMQTGAFTVRETRGAAPLRTSGASGDLLFEDDFSDPFSGWDREYEDDRTVDYSDGSYWFYLKEDTVALVTPELYFGDMSIEVEAATLSGAEVAFGIMCRYDSETGDFYWLEVNDAGQSAIYKWKDSEWVVLSDWAASAAILPGLAVNRLRADCVGDTLTLYVNDEFVAEAQDADLAFGDVGLLAINSQPGVELLFDNFVVRQP